MLLTSDSTPLAFVAPNFRLYQIWSYAIRRLPWCWKCPKKARADSESPSSVNGCPACLLNFSHVAPKKGVSHLWPVARPLMRDRLIRWISMNFMFRPQLITFGRRRFSTILHFRHIASYSLYFGWWKCCCRISLSWSLLVFQEINDYT